MLYKAIYIANDKWEEMEITAFLEEMRECNFSNETSKIRQPSLEPVS